MKTLMFLLILFEVAINAQINDWENQKSNTKQTLRSIFFADTLNGWACGDSSVVLKTTNGGQNWKPIIASNTGEHLFSINFTNKNKGFTVGNNGTILRSDDGGNIWKPCSEKYEINFRDLCFVDESNGWAVGRFEGINYGRGMIIHTADGGSTWQKQLEVYATKQSEIQYFSSIKMLNKNIGWAIASDYYSTDSYTIIYKTEDGGNNWRKISTLPFPSLKIKIANQDTLWCGASVASFFSISNDGGNTWNIFKGTNNLHSFGMTPYSGKNGWSCYRDYSSETPLYKVIYTENGGFSWRDETYANFIIVEMYNKYGILWLVGTEGSILKKRFISTSIEVDDYLEKFGYGLLSNYPNPFNNSTNISFALSKGNDVQINIYDITGKEIKLVVRAYYSTGLHTVSWDGKNDRGELVGSGFYIAKVVVKSNSKQSKKNLKMLLIK